MKKIILTALFIMGLTNGYTQNQTIWQIGEKDNSCSEFALSEKTYNEFVPQGFGGSNRYYVVNESTPSKDWPFILPGPVDQMIGGTFWSGFGMANLPVYFELQDFSKEENCSLVIDLLEVAQERAPILKVFVNGKPYSCQLKSGKSGNLPDKLKKNPQQVVFVIPGSEFKKGINEIVFRNYYGSWCVFDAITLKGPKSYIVKTPDKTLIRNVSLAEFKSKNESGMIQPLLIDLIHRGKTEWLTISVDGKDYKKKIEEGHTILEVNLPAVTGEMKSEVQISKGKKVLYFENIKRTNQPDLRLSDYVNQMMGSSGSRWMISPGPWMPMAMVKIAPDNEESRWKAGYEYQIDNIMGFSHVHDWTMAGLLMMPANGPVFIQPGPENNPDMGYRSRINKQTERAEVGLYSVNLIDYGIHADISATRRATMQRYILPEEKENRILVDLHTPAEYIWEMRDAEIKRVSDTELEGWAKSHCDKTGYAGENDYILHFVIQFDKPFTSMNGWVRDRILTNVDKIDKVSYEKEWKFYLKDYDMADAGAFVNFPKGTKEVKIRTGISLVSVDQARLNLKEEIEKPFGWDFQAVVENQKEVWDEIFNRVEIETDDYLQKVKFYSNMYRTLSRNCWSDVNGKWVDMNEKVQQSDVSKPIYGSDGYWGVHWNLVQFMNLITPEVSSNWINSLCEMYDKGGWLPIGNPGLEYFRVMIGSPAIPMIVSAYQHGIRDFDHDKMFKEMYHQQTSLMEKHPGGGEVGCESNNYYLKLGYVPLNKNYQSYVSNTMEYAYQDWCFAQFAKALNHDSVYKEFMKRSENWRNIFDEKLGFVRPRKEDGSWLENFDPFHSPGFVESNSWQYSWYVPQNVPALVKAMGRKRFIERLNEGLASSEKAYFNALGDNFALYPINHGNQSNMQSCYLFNFAGEPALTQKWARAIQERYYGYGVRDAYPGDEDQGQMSSWYVMSTIGLFQMDGGCALNPQYEIGSPRFERIKINLSPKYYSGKTFEIRARSASRNNKYIRSAKLNGKKLNTWRISASEVLKGGILELEMTDKPTNWGK